MKFYNRVFGAVVTTTKLNTSIGNRCIRFKIEEQHFSLNEENLEIGGVEPNTCGHITHVIQIFVDQVLQWMQGTTGAVSVSGVSRTMQKALEVGAVLVPPSATRNPILDLDDGSQLCRIKDPFGYIWDICSVSKNQQFLPISNVMLSN